MRGRMVQGSVSNRAICRQGEWRVLVPSFLAYWSLPRGVARRSAVESPARAATLQRYLPSMISACTGPRDGPAPLFLRYLPVSLNFSTTRRNLVEVAPKVEIQALLAPKKPKRPFGPQKGTLSIPSFTSYPPAVASTRHHARVQESPQGAPPPPCSPRGFAALKSAFRTPPAGPRTRADIYRLGGPPPPIPPPGPYLPRKSGCCWGRLGNGAV